MSSSLPYSKDDETIPIGNVLGAYWFLWQSLYHSLIRVIEIILSPIIVYIYARNDMWLYLLIGMISTLYNEISCISIDNTPIISTIRI